MRGVNKAIILGFVGRDPETRHMPNGNAVCNFSVATSEQWTDKQSVDKQERTEWHAIVAFGKLAEICSQYVRKGGQVYIEGKLSTSKWEKDGITRYSTQVIANEMQLLGSPRSAGSDKPQTYGKQGTADHVAAASGEKPAFDGDSDIPF